MRTQLLIALLSLVCLQLSSALPPETLVLTPQGMVQIQHLQAGDVVVGFDLATKKYMQTKIRSVVRYAIATRIKVTTPDDVFVVSDAQLFRVSRAPPKPQPCNFSKGFNHLPPFTNGDDTPAIPENEKTQDEEKLERTPASTEGEGEKAPEATAPEGTSTNETDDGVKERIKISEKAAGHIFRDEPGHLVEDTPENRELIETMVNKPENKKGIDKYEKEGYAETLETGEQIWAYVRKGEIVNAGINIDGEREFNKQNGFSQPSKPSKNKE